MSQIAAMLGALTNALLVALLPSPERERRAREHELDAPLCSFLFGLVQGAVGLFLYLWAGLTFMRGSAGAASLLLIGNWFQGLSTEHIRATGLISWLAWLIHPIGWPLAYLALVGLIRVVAFAATREAVGEPLLLVGLRSVQRVVARRRRERFLRRLGPPRADRLVRREREWLVVSCREKPGWDETATIEIGERHFRVTGVELRDAGSWESVVYRLAPEPDNAIIRHLVRYAPPGEEG